MQINVYVHKAELKNATASGDGGTRRRRKKGRIVNIKEATRLNDRKGQMFKKTRKQME